MCLVSFQAIDIIYFVCCNKMKRSILSNKILVNAFAFLVIIVVLGALPFMKRMERFMNSNAKSENLNELIDPKQLAVFQGVTANNVALKPIEFEDSSMKPSVDGTPNGPKSLFLFAYNKVSPECCIGERSSGYSTSGGCVCVTDKQRKHLAQNIKSIDQLDKCVFP
jgi:hypothetical protein